MKYPFFLIVFLILGGTSVSAQNFDEFRRQQQDAFQSFRQQTQQEFDEYRSKINAEFAEFLKKPWEQADGNEPLKEAPKTPDIPILELPIINIEAPKENRINVNIEKPKIEIEKVEKPEPIAPVAYTPKPKEKTLTFVFYGTEGTVRFDMNGKASLKGCAEKDVSAFWSELLKDNYDNLLADCLNLKEELDLCDWAYFKMTETVSEKIYGKTNEAVVLHFWLLSQSGFKSRLGCDNGNIHLLLHTNEMIFNKPYWNLNDGMYFLLDGSSVEKMSVMSMSFPETNALRLSIKNQNRFRSNDSEPRVLTSKNNPDVSAKVICNYNYLAFMNDYPISAIEGSDDTDLMKYVYTPLSQSAKDELYPALRQKIEGKNEEETANILLDFVQTAFAYKTDNEVWGLERPFFPEETLYYPYCDCEDRAILFCRLITDLMGLKTALVSYPGHVAAAVQFGSEIPGDFFVIDGKRFLICDPTYINAPIGKSMPRKNNATAKVYPL